MAAKTKNVSIFTILKTEHEEVKSLLEFAETCSVDKRQAVLKKIEKALVPHARGEEKTLYAILRAESLRKDNDEGIDVSNEAYEEHRVVDDLLFEIKSVRSNDETWIAKLKVIKENLTHHIKEEEQTLFKMCKELIPEETLVSVSTAYEKAKAQFERSLPTQSQIDERTPVRGINPNL